MSKQNKVATNLQQDFTDAEKLQARQNIGASQISYDNALTDMTVTKEIVRPSMNTKYTATVGNDNFLLLPSTFGDGMVVKANDSLQTQSIPEGLPTGGVSGQELIIDSNGVPAWADTWHPSRNFTLYVDNNNILHAHQGIYNNHETFGSITFRTDKAGSYSVVPLGNTNQFLSKYSVQCTHANNVNAGSVTLPFFFNTEAKGVTDIAGIGIKGSSGTTGANVSIDDVIIMYRN